ncbi:hypothetical protein AB0P21_05630 [Kribbella sp. NPDC056861]|uniref:hypothetical protein n=1 Tax=Kribbella sp. NPDC056861 TaxID=3154857 RepID=UPI0034492BA7
MATTVGGLAAPAPIDWTATPTGPENAVLYTTEKAGNSLWSVGINLEPGPEGTLAFHPLALRWNGKAWQQTKQPVPDGRLDDVLAKSANDVWAVGATENGAETEPVLQHWNGKAWKLLDTPTGAPEESTQFTAIAKQGNGLLVGRYGDQSSVLRYVGGKWTELPREGLQHVVYLDDLAVVNDKEIWAAGIGGVARFDGTRWTKVELPVKVPEGRSLEVAQLVVKSANDIWAVGMKNDTDLWRRPLALHFDGKVWTELAAPAVTGQFHDLEFLDGKAVAVGGNPNTGKPLVTELVGKEFVQTTPPAGAGYLHGSTQVGKCLWTVGVAAETTPDGFEKPFVAVGKHRADAGHGSLPAAC